METEHSTDFVATALAQLGLSQYEARAFCALVGSKPLIGHEVAKASGIPTSKIYETLNRLAEKGAVLVHRTHPVTYVAIPHEQFLASAREKFDRAMTAADVGLRRLPVRQDAGEVWSMRHRDAVVATCTARIETAKRIVHAALWDEELPAIAPSLEAASERGLDVHVAVYGRTRLNGPHHYDLAACGISAVERLGGRRLSAVACDEAYTLIAEFQADGTVEAVATDNPVLCLLAVEYIKSDVLGRMLIDELGEARFAALRQGSNVIESLLRS